MRAHVLLICPRMRSSALTALYVYTRSGQAVKRKKGPGQTVKRGFRAESSGQDRFQAVKNLDPGRGRSYGKYWSDRPLIWDFKREGDALFRHLHVARGAC